MIVPRYIFPCYILSTLFVLSTLFQMAAVFQFHRFNQHPLHFSYITFAIISLIMLPPPNKKSGYSDKPCYDLGTNTDAAEFAEVWDILDVGSTSSENDTVNEKNYFYRYVKQY